MTLPDKTQRDIAIDWLRGLVMVVMALDHARDFACGFGNSPTDLKTTTPILFATRIVTHFCAPLFVLLAGVSAYLYGQDKSRSQLQRFLVSRGLWLVLLEVTVIRLGWIPDPGYHYTVLQVIWAIGCSMIALAALCWLPLAGVAAVGFAIVLGHNLLDSVQAASFGNFAWLWNLLHQPTTFDLAQGRQLTIIYAVLPWIGVIALGFACGPVVARAPEQRRAFCLWAGIAVSALFVVVRGLNGYGDPTPWTEQRSLLFTVMSFVNCEKYPPSLAYLCMTLGPGLIALALAPRSADSPWVRPLVVFGRVPLFYYIAHVYLLRYSLIPLAIARFGERAYAMPPDGTAGSPELPLAYAYLAWLAALLVLYPACRWYARIKGSGQYPWLRYL